PLFAGIRAISAAVGWVNRWLHSAYALPITTTVLIGTRWPLCLVAGTTATGLQLDIQVGNLYCPTTSRDVLEWRECPRLFPQQEKHQCRHLAEFYALSDESFAVTVGRSSAATERALWETSALDVARGGR